MLLKGGKGIICDFTGNTYKDKFKYYPIEVNEVVVKTSKRYVYPPKKISEHDLGEECFNQYFDIMKSNPREMSRKAIPCDLCPATMTGDFTYYYIKVAEVEVDTTNENSSTKVNRNFLEIRVCKNCYENMMSRVKNLKNKIEQHGEWT